MLIVKKKKKQLLLYTYDPVTLKQIGKEEILLTSRYDKANNYIVRVSPDKSKLLFLERNKNLGKQGKNFDFIVLNNKGKRLWEEGNSSLKKEKMNGFIANAIIDNSGSFILLRATNKRSTLFLSSADFQKYSQPKALIKGDIKTKVFQEVLIKEDRRKN